LRPQDHTVPSFFKAYTKFMPAAIFRTLFRGS